MCEILLRVVDKVNYENPYKNAECLKRGDVVVVVEDGHVWGAQELRNPDWRILKVPGVSVSAASAFLGEELDSNPGKPSLTLQSRAFGFDLEHKNLPGDFAAWIADGARGQRTYTLSVTDAKLASFKVKKAALADPNIL